MAVYVMGETRYVDGQLAEATNQWVDKAEPPIIFLKLKLSRWMTSWKS
jgi:hypothetical protein